MTPFSMFATTRGAEIKAQNSNLKPSEVMEKIVTTWEGLTEESQEKYCKKANLFNAKAAQKNSDKPLDNKIKVKEQPALMADCT